MSATVFHVIVVTCILMTSSQPRPLELWFTRTFYNVTIPENSISRTLVTSAERMGVFRQGSDDDVTFRIVSGDPDRIFKVEDKVVGDFIFLVLRTRAGNSVVLNRERKDKYVLTVKAFSSRSTIEATTIINIRVLDQNDLSPIFFPSNYNRTLPEDLSLRGRVNRVSCEDADLGVNGEVLYWIKEHTEHFTVHPYTGVVYLTKRLKYSERSIHDLTIVAQDRATIFRGGGQSSLATMSLRIKQVNLYGPEIYVYVLQDPTAHKLGLLYAVVRVMDRDEGLHGQIGDVEIVSGDSEGVFIVCTIDDTKNSSRTEYNIILINGVTLVTTPHVYNLSLQVADKGFPKRISYKAVSVLVKYDSDLEQLLGNDSYEIDVPEYLPPGSPILRLNITNKDLLLENKIDLQLTEGNSKGMFQISFKSWVLHSISPINSQELRTFSLGISVNKLQKDAPKKLLAVKVKINVIDYNDNNPIFKDFQEEVWINENLPSGTQVTKVFATDDDIGENGFVTYSIANLKFVPFEIDALSGVLRTTQPLDFESMKRDFVVRVRASDSGMPYRRETEKYLKVQVRNLNDNSPEFSKGDCSLSIPKNIETGTQLFTLTATDLDEMDLISYSISSSTGSDCITIDSKKGILLLNCDLTEVSKTEWELNVTASDGLHKTKTYVRVFVAPSENLLTLPSPVQYSCRDSEFFKDEPKAFVSSSNSLKQEVYDNLIDYEITLTKHNENLNDPIVMNLPNKITLNGSASLNEEVFKVIATDKDYGYNGMLVFGLPCDREDCIFKIDPDSGVITVISSLSLVENLEHLLNITICDQGKPERCISESLKVHLMIGNERKLRFSESFSKVHVTESFKVGSEITRVKAIDSKNVTYHLISSKDHFSIDSKNGSVVLSKPFDREEENELSATIRATETNNSSVYSDTTIRFVINDVNDNAPIFVNTELVVHVREDVPEGSVIFIFTATDKDSLAAGEMSYSVVQSKLFAMDSSTGTLRLRGRLDYESESEHLVLVQVSEKGVPPLQTEATLTVNVVDVNENLHPPVFDEVVITVSGRENLPAGSLVTLITASDADPPGVDSKVTYHLKDGTGLGFFTITEQGSIHTAAVLDTETSDHFWLTVVAVDGGMVPLSASVQVYISVDNDNDHLPLTMDAVYHFSVEENLPPHTPVGHVIASDGDWGITNLNFNLIHQLSHLPFAIDKTTGILSTTNLLDREDVQEYIFQVVVSDRGSPELSSVTEVRVSVGDVNDHTPQFHADHYSVRLPQIPQPLPEKLIVREVEQVLPEGDKWTTSTLRLVSDSFIPLAQVLATDADSGHNGTVEYSVQSGALFLVDKDTGLLFARSRLGAGREYEVLVRATDHGEPRKSSVASVSVHTFHKQHVLTRLPRVDHVMAEVRESLSPGEVVIKLEPPVVDKKQLNFVLSGGSRSSYFAMHGDSLLLAKSLDCEEVSSTELTATAANHSAVWDIKISLKVLDENEHPPQFEESLYYLNVSEAAPMGSVLTTLRASDKDVTSTLYYSVHNYQPSSEMFTLDPATGDLTLTGSLDRETCAFHQLTVKVSDGGEPPRHGFARVHIRVQDENDHRPRWPADVLNLRLLENTPVGTQVAQVVATDQDIGDFGTVDYTIISGNINSTFKIHHELGRLQLTKPIQAFNDFQFHLIVRSQDHGFPQLFSDMEVQITVLPSEKKSPVCEERNAWIEVSENVFPGTVVGRIKVERLPSLWYELVAGDVEGCFSINPTSGDVILQQLLDYETTPLYNLTVTVTSLAGLHAHCSITVHVVDYNDNAPWWREEQYWGTVREGAPVGTLVMTPLGPLTLSADDLDSGTNGLLDFKVLEGPGQDLITIDSITGAVRTAKVLDYEQMKDIQVLIAVSDRGQPRLTSKVLAALRIEIKDINDCPPKFTQETYNATVLLPTRKDVLVIQISADDEDSSEITSLRYSIISGNEDLALTVDSGDGKIYIQEPLRIRTRRLTVKAHDGLHENLAYVDVHVQQKEQSAIRFQRALYFAAVLENSTKVSTVAVVNVLGTSLNENIRFTIQNRCPQFSIGSTSGVISTVGHVFDREHQSSYQLAVQAYSQDRHILAHTTVNVSVLDANDNCPQFINLPYRATITSNATKGDFVFKVLAKDADVGENGEVRYELDQSGSEMFRIGRKSGEIRIKTLSVHNRPEILVSVSANDGGIVPCSTVTTVTVSMIDSRAPLWERTVYKAKVAESAPLLSPVSVSLKAMGVNKVIYELTSDSFIIRHDTGVLQVYDTLNRETTAVHSMTVRATDSVTGLTSETLLLLEVTDVNDCYPQFSQELYEAAVSEGAEPGTVVTRVSATDLDKGMNGVVRFSLTNSYFRVNSTDGTITVANQLDYERSDRHHLTVTATDAGVPALCSFVNVLIEVTNTNDNAPILLPPTSVLLISQNAVRGSFVGKLIAMDKDGDPVTFRITNADNNVKRTFTIDKKTGVISVLNPSALTLSTHLLLDISVDDGLYSTNGSFNVTVTSSNNHAPVFDMSRYEAVMAENLPPGRIVIRVTATDKDVGVFGDVSYILPLQRSSKFFAVNNGTGDVTTLLPLDRETMSSHTLTVMALDGGGLRGWTTVRVKVLDENDNAPRFQLPRYFGCLMGNVEKDESIMQVKALDDDESMAAELKYAITRVSPQQATEWFHIHPHEGALSARTSLKNKDPQVLSMTLTVTDGGSPPLHSDVNVTLILSRDKNPTTLRQSPSHFFIPKSANPGHVIHHFQLSSSMKVLYQLIGGEESIVINSTGHLLLKRIPVFKQKIMGLYIHSLKPAFTFCDFKEITIEIQAFDEEPRFVDGKLQITVPENLADGSLICRVFTENDVPAVFGFLDPSELFFIDPLTGWVSLISSLDREKRTNHEVVVVASHAQVSNLSSSCLIFFTVTDINDNPQIFNQEVYNVAVKEDASVGTVLTRLSLIDPDEVHGNFSLYVTEGDSALFSVTAALEVVLTAPLDRESHPGHTLTVLATDGLYTTTTVVNVVVIDVNDERHICLHPQYNVTVSEGQSPGFLVATILTSDHDLESNLEFRLAGVATEKFFLDNHGELRLNQYLDRETCSVYLVDVRVVDSSHPDWTCSSRVRVEVEDVNDNPPTFAVANETITLTEDAAVGMLIARLQVFDLDLGENRRLNYFLVNPSGLFNLTTPAGVLTLARPLQSAPGSVHSVTVGVSDLGSPRLTTVSTLQVVVLGMNDDPPLQVTSTLHVTVSEDAPLGTSLLHVQALAEAPVKSAHVIHTILEGNNHGEFEIDKKTGVLTTCKILDYEARQSYQLLILATSLGDTSYTSYVSVNVTIVDVNDNPPVFKVTRYSVQIREDVEVGQIVLKVDADDPDSGKNGVIKFFLDEESSRKFTVETFTGVLMVASSLDREQTAQYVVLVHATDQGTPPLSATATVNIDVTDYNDNPPLFVHPNATAVLQADRMAGWAVFHFAVTDMDQPTASSYFSFRLTSGNEQGMFRVDPDGTLRTTDKLNIRLGDVFRLTVRVDDGGSPNLFSSTWIYIKVVEPSKHPPEVLPLRVWVGVYEGQWQGGELGHVTASDLDPYDKLEFSVPATPQFSVDPRQGTLKARGSLAPGVHDVNVSVTDGKYSSSGVVTVTVQPLAQDMLQSSVYIRLQSRVKHDTLVRKLPLFLSTLRSAFLRDVTLISVQDIPNSTVGMLVAVAGGADLHVVREVMDSVGLSGSTPECDCRNGGVCQRQLQMMPERMNVFSAAGLSFVTPGHSLAYYCICSMGYAGEHCEDIKCLCPPLQVCVPQRVGFACMPPCSANQTCPAAMTSSISWTEVITCLLSLTVLVVTITAFIIYRRYRRTTNNDKKYGSWGKHNCYMNKRAKLSNLEASQKPPIFTGSPNNGTLSRNNLDSSPGAAVEGETIPLEYLRNINPVTVKMENDIIQGHGSAPDLATCHSVDSFVPDDPARDLAALDDQLQDVIQYGFPPPGLVPALPEELEVPL